MMIKKWLSILIVLGFASTYVYAADDDWEEEEEEEEPVKKSSKKKTSKKSDDGPSRIGLAVGFGGASDRIGLVYDLGSGLEFGVGLGLVRKDFTPDEGDDNYDPWQDITIVPSIKYALGKGLLDYGLGVDVTIVSKDAGMDMSGFPNFYASAELVKNVSLALHAGINVDKLKGNEGGREGSWLNMDFRARGVIIFYFL
ncbi:MAG: hypothetical protein LBQ87_04210 [Candidatus Fibromonas sp.]|jgi:hypothetical protein|nr:hypothetical protein [Candidatus Fibromonas sp.]